MVGLWSLSSREDASHDPSDDHDSSFLRPFPDFDPVKEWLIDPDHTPMLGEESKDPNPVGSDPKKVESDLSTEDLARESRQEEFLRSSIDEKMEKVRLVETVECSMDPKIENGEKRQVFEASVEVGNGVSLDSSVVGGEERNGSKGDGLSEVCSVSDPIKVAHETDDEERSEDSEEESDDSSSESASSSSSSDEEEDDEVVEVEEGEIRGCDREEVILGSDEEEEVPKGPIKSKHEIEVLPPVLQVEVSLEPHHQTLPVGVISSIMGSRVIVEGSVKHSPLNEGSILWITETRLPLGLVDEIFGPVKNPYYVVRYNSDEEVPAGITVGAAISFVIEFANHILNEKDLYKKGYDASGDNDEEASDVVEFSDDEKEAEYRRSLRQSKRVATHVNQESGFGKKTNFKGPGIRKDERPLPATMGRPLSSQLSQLQAPLAIGNFGCRAANPGASIAPSPMMVPAFPQQLQAPLTMGNFGCRAANPGVSLAPSPMMVPAFPQQPQAFQMDGSGGFGVPSQQFNTVWAQGGLPMNWLPVQQFGDQTYHLQHQNQFSNSFAGGMMPYLQLQQQLVPNLGAPSDNVPWFGGPLNPLVGLSSAMVEPMGQGGFSLMPFGCGNVNPQGTLGLCNEQSHGQAGPLAVGQVEMRPPMEFNRGRSSFRGRRPYKRGGHQRGGRHNFGSRGGHQ